MSPRTEEDNSILREKSASHLLQIALELFSSNGYHETSMSDLARAAGVSKGLAYHYFKNKASILVTLAEKRLREWEPLVAGLEEIEEPAKRLIFLVDFIFEELKTKTRELRFYNALYLSEDGVAAIEKAMVKYQKQFKRLFLLEIKLAKDLGFSEPAVEAIYLRSTLQGICLEYMLGPRNYPLEAIRKSLIGRYKKGSK